MTYATVPQSQYVHAISTQVISKMYSDWYRAEWYPVKNKYVVVFSEPCLCLKSFAVTSLS